MFNGGGFDTITCGCRGARDRLAIAARSGRRRLLHTRPGRHIAVAARLRCRFMAARMLRRSGGGRFRCAEKHVRAEEPVFPRRAFAFRRLNAHPQCRRHHGPGNCRTNWTGEVEHRSHRRCRASVSNYRSLPASVSSAQRINTEKSASAWMSSFTHGLQPFSRQSWDDSL
jgi:hypothetical protein